MSDHSRRRRNSRGEPERLARGLGWLSIGLGVAQVFAPRRVAALTGVALPPALVVLCGLRELACGAGLLTQDQPAPWIKARVAGDALDLAALAAGAAIPGAQRRRIAVAGGIAAGIAAADLYCGRALGSAGHKAPPRHEALTIEIDHPPEALYAFWRDLSNLPQFMPHLESVQILDETYSHWVAAGPAGTRIEWDAEVIDDQPGQRIAWRSVDGAPIFNAGSVQFRPAPGGGTHVSVELLYEMRAGSIGEAVAQLFGVDPAHQARADLLAFKRLAESGGIPPAAPRST